MLRNGLEPWHLILILLVLVLLFGSKKLPEMARGLGKSMRIIKAESKALREDDDVPPEPVQAQALVTEPVPGPAHTANAAEQPLGQTRS